jgi:hypothetical protein
MNAFEILHGLAPGESLDYERYDCPACGRSHIVLIRRVGLAYLAEVLTGGKPLPTAQAEDLAVPVPADDFEDAKIQAEIVYARLDGFHQSGDCLD